MFAFFYLPARVKISSSTLHLHHSLIALITDVRVCADLLLTFGKNLSSYFLKFDSKYDCYQITYSTVPGQMKLPCFYVSVHNFSLPVIFKTL